MAEGGGFCERHGPYDPPDLTCPFCAMEKDERRVYGPPAEPPPATGFVRQTVEPEVKPVATELISRRTPDDAPPDEEPDEIADLPPGVESRLLGWLVVRQPVERRGTVLPVGPNQVIGREGDIRWDDPGLSRQHARLTLEPAEEDPDGPPVYHLWPFGPTNPVFINGRESRGATPLRENDEIQLGDTLFVFKTLVD